MASTDASTSAKVVLGIGHRNAHAAPVLPDGAAHPAGAVTLDRPDDLIGPCRSAEVDQDLVEHHLIGDGHLRQRGQGVGEGASQGAAAIDEVDHARPAQLAQGGPGGEATRPPRRVGHEVAGRPERVRRGGIEVGGAICHGSGVSLGIGAEGVAAVVGDVEPFVAVAPPGVRPLEAGDEVAGGRAGGGPQAESPVHVNPRPGPAAQVADGGEVIERAGVDVARLGADDGGRAGTRLQGPIEGVDLHGPVGIGGQFHHRRPAQPEKPQRRVHAGMALLAGQDPDGRRTGQPSLLDVPAGLLEDPVPAGRQPDGVGARCAGHQSKRGGFGDTEQVF